MTEKKDEFRWKHLALIRRVLSQTRKMLHNSNVQSFESMDNLGKGLYLFGEDKYLRALNISQGTLSEEFTGGEIREFPSCIFQHGGVLTSKESDVINLLVLAELNWYEDRTDLWLPWLRFDEWLRVEGGFRPSESKDAPGSSLYISRAGARMRDILSKIRYVEHHITKGMTPSDQRWTNFFIEDGTLPDDGTAQTQTTSGINSKDLLLEDRITRTQKVVLPREGGSYVIADDLRDSPDLAKWKPTNEFFVKPYYSHKGQILLGPSTRNPEYI